MGAVHGPGLPTARAPAGRPWARPGRPWARPVRRAYTRVVTHVPASGSSSTAAMPAAMPAAMDDPRWQPGMPVLERQPIQEPAPSLAGLPPRSVPEARPTPLPRDWFIYLSVVAFVCGAVAITALEFGAGPGSPLVRLCVVVGSPPLAIALADASVRIWRSAWAWMPVDRVKGFFRLAWLVVPAVGFAGIAAALAIVLSA